MGSKDQTKPPRSTNPSQRPQILEADQLSTQTIDLGSLLTKDVTTSGSFDIRGNIWATTFGKLMEALPIPALLIDQSCSVIGVNQACGRISAEYEKILGTLFSRLFPHASAARQAQSLVEEIFATRKPRIREGILQIAQGRMWGRMTFRPIRIGEQRLVLVLVEDLTSEKKELLAQEKLTKQMRESLKEKDAMLGEIRHRVKDNLAVVAGMLRSQSGYATDEAHRRMLKGCESRVTSMALAHELLYRSENLSDIRVNEYVSKLLDYLVGAMKAERGRVDLKKEIEDVVLGLDKVIPVGLILSELVSNSLQHAFPEKKKGQILVSLRSIGELDLELIVKDNGVGMPEDVDLPGGKSMHLELVRILATQLGGKIKIVTDKGTQVSIKFRASNP